MVNNKKKLVENLTVGTDPEMFLYSNKLKKYFPACGLIGGNKENPLPISSEGHAIQEDNVMAEFCIPPCKNAEDFKRHIAFVKDYINDTILKGLKVKVTNEIGELEEQDIELVCKCDASAEFDPQDLQSEQAQMFGCDPDYNAYTGEPNVVERQNPFLRSCGGHIHIGYDNPDFETNIKIIKALDLFLGLGSVMLDPDNKRRELYGKAGAYRLKKYGAEYRVTSNFFLNNEDLMDFVFWAVERAIEFVNDGGIITNEADIIEAINTSNKDLALEILEDYNVDLEIIENLKAI